MLPMEAAVEKPPDQPSGPGHRWQVFGICLFLAVAVFAVFGQTVHYDFVNFDDNGYVYENPMVKGGMTLESVIWTFTHGYESNWHPLTTISHMMDCQLYGVKAGGHHMTNVLLHGANAI